MTTSDGTEKPGLLGQNSNLHIATGFFRKLRTVMMAPIFSDGETHD
jgi:hypothetical protein